MKAFIGICCLFASFLLAANLEAGPRSSGDFKVESLSLSGAVDKGNAKFALGFKLKAEGPCTVEMVSGEVSELASEIKTLSGGGFFSWTSPKPKVSFRDGGYWFESDAKGEYEVSFAFAAKVSETDDVKGSSFGLLAALSRKLKVELDAVEADLDVAGALGLKRMEESAGKNAVFEGLLEPSGAFNATWRRHVESADSELVASAGSAFVYDVQPGAVKLSAFFDYKVTQGKLQELKFTLSPDLNVLKVSGQDIQDWRVEKGAGSNTLTVKLSGEHGGRYALRLEAETPLSEFPCKFRLPSAMPEGILKSDGQLAFGTCRALRLIIDKVEGLSQIDNKAFTLPELPETSNASILPTRSLYTYQLPGGKWSLDARADNIEPVCSLSMNCAVAVKDEDLSLKAVLELDIKDAPLKELCVAYDSDLTFGHVEGSCVKAGEYELSKAGGVNMLRLPLKPDTIGKASLVLYFDKPAKDRLQLKIPSLQAQGMKSVRGYLLLSADKGLSVKTSALKGLKEVNLGSAPMREPGLQLVYRFKDEGWGGMLEVKRERTSLVAEAFHLASVGEGAVYGSSIFSLHVTGAPIDKLTFQVDPAMRNLEFTGRGVTGWRKASGELWTLSLGEKILGDITILATYELPLQGASSKARLGAVSLSGADSESGYIAIGSQRNLGISAIACAEGVEAIELAELPEEYRKIAANPLMKAFRCLKAPHWAEVSIDAYPEERLLGAIADQTSIRTRIDRNGAAQTDVEYRVKNAKLQFLRLKLPAGAKLWSATANGVECRASVDGDSLLVPLPATQDTSVPIAVSLRYMQTFGALADRRDIALKAPSLDIESLLCKWTVDAPDDYSFASLGGNMEPETELPNTGFGQFIGGMLGVFNALDLRAVAGLLLLALAGLPIAASYGACKLRLPGVLASLALGVVGLAVAAPFLFDLLRMALWHPGSFAVNQIEFSRSYFMAGDPPSLNAVLESQRGFGLMRTAWAAGLLLVSALALGAAFKLRGLPARGICLAIAALALALGGSQWTAFNTVAAPLTALALFELLVAAVWTLVYGLLKGRRPLAAMSALLLALAPWGADASDIQAAAAFDDASFKVVVEEKAVKVSGDWTFKADGPVKIPLLGSPAAISSFSPEGGGAIELLREDGSYFLKARRAGSFKFHAEFLVPLKGDASNPSFEIPLAQCRRNSFDVRSEREHMEIVASNAALFTSAQTGRLWHATASFAPGANACFALRPQRRNTGDERMQFFASVDGSAKFMPGFVETSYLCKLRIAQGEALSFAIEIPERANVISVEAKDLGAWRFDAAKRLLDVTLSRPHTGDYSMTVVTQLGDCQPPCKANLSTVSFPAATRQYGSLGLFCDAALQLQVIKSEGFSAINNSDFAPGQTKGPATLRKAFRFFKTPCSLQVEATPVEAEIRVVENVSVRFEEERCAISAALDLDIVKSGVFAVALRLPKGFELDMLTGSDIQHWDEIDDNGAGKLIVNFARRMSGRIPLKLELSRMGRLKEGLADIPKIEVVDASRLNGELSISVERGVRMDIVARQGVEPRPAGIAKPSKGVAGVFAIQRTDWSLSVSFNSAEPWVKAESIQQAKCFEGWVEGEAFFDFVIENAGVKGFAVRLPEKAESVEFISQGLASFTKDAAKPGVWEVELNQKTGREHALTCRYRLPYEGAKLSLAPVSLLNVQSQTGHYSLTADGSSQIKLVSKEGDATDFDPRKLPPSPKTGKPGPSTLCFRTVGDACKFDIELIRRKAAETLKAEVKSLELSSVATVDGMLVTKAAIQIENGNQGFLKTSLPAGAALWSVFVDGQPVETAREPGKAEAILIPLRQSMSGRRPLTVEFIYSLAPSKSWSQTRQAYVGPSFELPLQNVSWTLHLPPSFSYGDFKGTLDCVSTLLAPPTAIAGMEGYDVYNRSFLDERLKKAKDWLDKGGTLAKQGRQVEASEAFQNAMNLSANDAGLNNDIQGRWLETQRAQNVQSMAQLRDGLGRKAAPRAGAQEQRFDGQASLNASELKSLQAISDRLFMQQRAAIAVPRPLAVNVPDCGASVRFERALQAEPYAPMEVSFTASKSLKLRNAQVLYAAAAFGICASLCVLALGFAIRTVRRREKR